METGRLSQRAGERILCHLFLTLVAAVISLAFSCLLPFALGQVDRYRMDIVEKGTKFSEQIEVDEKQDVEVFRVPAHNDVDGADFYHDFKRRVTVTRIPSRKVCYISEMDPSLSSPGKLKADLERAASQPGKRPVTEKRGMVEVIGPAYRRSLTKEILDFCGAFPIYNTEVFNNPNIVNGTATIRSPNRERRQSTGTSFRIRKYRSCIMSVTHGAGDPLKYVKQGNCVDKKYFDLQCQIRNLPRNCYFTVECTNTKQSYGQSKWSDWICNDLHVFAVTSFCCDPICPST